MSARIKLKGAALALLWVITVTLVVIWDQNPLSIVASGLGVSATLLLLFDLRWWRGIGAVASALFLVNWALALLTLDSAGSYVEMYWSGLWAAIDSGAGLNRGVILVYELALPIVHIIVSIALVVAQLKRNSGK